jgi:hypothetical protein
MKRDRKTISASTQAQPTARETPSMKLSAQERQDKQEWLLDEALSETFPASDPISPSILKA